MPPAQRSVQGPLTVSTDQCSGAIVVAGLVVSFARETDWVHRSLEPFRVVFVPVFFVSGGMLIDLEYVAENGLKLGLLVLVIVVANTLINSAVLRLSGSSWRRASYAGALLSQVGEFSFILVAMAHTESMLSDADYRLFLAVIALSLTFSPAWIGLCKAVLGHREGRPERVRV